MLAAAVGCRLGYDAVALSGSGPGSGGTSSDSGVDVGGTSSAVGGTSSAGTGGTAAMGGGGAASAGGATSAGGTFGTGAGGGVSSGGDGGAPACVPSNGSVEACDGLDNDCNGQADETSPCAADCFAATFGEHGYMFCGTPRLWSDAQAYCAQSSMSLVRVDDAGENNWLTAIANADPTIAASFAVFIGANDLAVEGEWRWTDGEQFWSGASNGSVIGGLYVNWKNTEPNDKSAGGENCGGLGEDGTWTDLRCTGSGSEMPFVCETP